MTTIIEKIRNLISDNLITTGRDVFIYESITASKIFTLTESNISVSSIIVLKNGVVWAPANYSYSAVTGKLTVTGTLVVGDSLEVDYSYYSKYSDNELKGFIKAAISYLIIEKYKVFSVRSSDIIFPTPDEAEENLIAIIASILIKSDVISYRTPELSMAFERGDSKEKKIKKFIKHFKKTYGILDYVNLERDVVLPEED